MRNIYFNKGAEQWVGYYYDILKACITDADRMNEFGDFMEEKFNTPDVKAQLCLAIADIVHSSVDKSEKPANENIDDGCFAEGRITFNRQFQYIKFPDFESKSLQGHVLRIDINPCLKRPGSMTKIYCISRFNREIEGRDVVDFFNTSRVICENIIQKVAEVYLKLMNDFLVNSEKESNDASYKPYKIFSSVFGSDDSEVQQFIQSTNKSAKQFQLLAKKNEKAQVIQDILNQVNKSLNRSLELSDYEWIRSDVELQTKSASGYIGYTSKEENTYFIGVANSYPREVLLPLHLQIIEAN